MQPYPPVTIAVCFFLLFRVHMGCAPPPLSSAACHTSLLLQAFPSPSTLGEVAPHLPTLAGMFIYSSRGKYPSPTLQWNPPHDSHCYKLSHSKVAGRVLSFLASLVGLFIYSSTRECPSPTLWSSGCPALFATFLFFSAACLLFSLFFSFFPWVGVSLSRGLC
jgi:hypothetical protein